MAYIFVAKHAVGACVIYTAINSCVNDNLAT